MGRAIRLGCDQLLPLAQSRFIIGAAERSEEPDQGSQSRQAVRCAFWARQVSLARTAIEGSDAWGLQKFLSLLGGMGSLNDYVRYRGGDPLVAENDDLHKLLGEATGLATDLRRAYEREQRT